MNCNHNPKFHSPPDRIGKKMLAWPLTNIESTFVNTEGSNGKPA